MSKCVKTIGNSGIDIKTDAKKYYEKYWLDGREISGSTSQRYKIIFERFFEDGIKGKRILEIGVGGEGGAILHLKNKNEVHGIDASTSAKEICKKFGLDVTVANLDTEDIPFDDGYFDVVFAFEVFEHFANPQFVVEEIRRVVKNGGMCLLSTPNPLTHHWPRLFYPSLFEAQAFEEFLMLNRFKVGVSNCHSDAVSIGVYKKLLPKGNSHAWNWLWCCEKIKDDEAGIFLEYGKHFWGQKNEQGIRIRPIEALDMLRLSLELDSGNMEARFHLAMALVYRLVNGEGDEFHQNLSMINELATKGEYPLQMEAMYHQALIHLELKRFEMSLMTYERLICLIDDLSAMPDAGCYVESIREVIKEVCGDDYFLSGKTDNTVKKETKEECKSSTENIDRKEESYYCQERREVVAAIPIESRVILDVGCGEGQLGKSLLKRGAEEVIGIELSPEVCHRAEKNISKVICGDVEDLNPHFKEGYFDCIVFADILEHLRDPTLILKKYKRYLKDSGCIVTSIPNVRYYGVINMLIEGYWTYADHGILDRTHLRFFTKKEMEATLKEAGFTVTGQIVNIDPAYNALDKHNQSDLVVGKAVLRGLTRDEIRDCFVFQYIMKSKKADGLSQTVESLIASGNLHGAKNMLQAHLKAYSTDIDALQKYAELCHSLGLIGEAKESLERVLLFAPDRLDAQELKRQIEGG